MAASGRPEIISDTLSNLDTESVYVKAKNKLNGGFKFIFSVFYSVSCFFFILFCLSPLLCGMILPAALQTQAIILFSLILGSIFYFALIIGFGVNIFSNMATYHKLDVLMPQDDCDAIAIIKKQLNDEWHENDDANSSTRVTNVKVLIGTLIRKKNWYFKLIKPLVAWCLFLCVGMPTAIVGWLFFYCPIMFGLPVALITIGPSIPTFVVGILSDIPAFISAIHQFISSFTGGAIANVESFISNLPGSLITLTTFVTSMEFILPALLVVFAVTWLIYLFAFVLVVTTALVIWRVTNSIIERNCITKWVKTNLPEDYESYRKNILRKKK